MLQVTFHLCTVCYRVVQRADQPIILTGYQALNKLLGRAIYTSQLQLGGPQVMAANGISHLTVPDDLSGVSAILQWLSFVPLTLTAKSAAGSLSTLPVELDPLDRPLSYAPPPGGRFDVRHAITGEAQGAGKRSGSPSSGQSSGDGASAADSGTATPQRTDSPGGLFDDGSWVEYQAGWARTVVTGRARLGGVPVGVLGVESATVTLALPADPGLPDSAEQSIPQAGQVRASSPLHLAATVVASLRVLVATFGKSVSWISKNRAWTAAVPSSKSVLYVSLTMRVLRMLNLKRYIAGLVSRLSCKDRASN